MTLKLEMLASLDAKGVAAGASEARREVASLGKTATANAKQTETAYRAQTREAKRAAAAAAKAARASQNGGLQAANANKLAAHEATNLSFQMNDIAVGLTSGQSPFTVMMQQGSQVSQIMGRRGLGQIIPALGAGLMSLISPTTLLLAGITAVGYAASSVFSSMRNEAEDTDVVIERHTDLIRDIKEAYRAAGEGAKQYGIQSKAVLDVQRQENAADLEKRLKSQLDALITGDAFEPGRFRGLGVKTPLYGAIIGQLETFRQAVEQGEADLKEFNRRLAELYNTDGVTARQKEFVDGLIDASEGAFETSEKLKEIRQEMEELGEVVDRVSLAKFFGRQSDQLTRLIAETARLRQSVLDGDGRKPAEASRIRALASLNAEIEIARRKIDQDSEEADHLRETALAIANVTIARDEQKAALDRVIGAKEFLMSQDEEIARLKLETTLIGRSNTERSRQIALLEAEQEIRNRKLDGSSDQAEAIRQAALGKASARAAQESARALHDLNQSHAEQMERLQLEQALLGQSNALRSTALTLLLAEQDIRRRGIDTNSELAQSIRRVAAERAGETAELNRQKKAWTEVEKAGSSAIDKIINGLSSGKPGEILSGIAADLSKTVLELGAGNPLKNLLYGKDLPTFDDTGGIGGFFKSLFGGGPQAMNAANMNVQAANVMLNGGMLGSAFGALGGGAQGLAQGAAGSLGGGSVAAQAWNFFTGKGLEAHKVAGILGNIKAESAFNPLAVGDGGNAFGLFQHNDRRHNLFSALGGRSNLGNVQGQLEFAWKELMTTESRAFRNLMGSTDVRGATAAFGGFERPRGFSYGNPEAMHNWTGRLEAAEQALNQFGGKAGAAATALAGGGTSLANTATAFAGQSEGLADSLSNGIQNLVNSFPAAPLGGGGGGGLAGWVSRLASGFGGGSQLSAVANGAIGLFDKGRFTGAGRDDELAGFTHRNEFVFSAPAVRAIGVKNLDALHSGAVRGVHEGGFRDGGFVSSNATPFARGSANANSPAGAATSGDIAIQIIDNVGVNVSARQEPDGRGGRRISLVVEGEVADAISRPGSAANQALRARGARAPRVKA